MMQAVNTARTIVWLVVPAVLVSACVERAEQLTAPPEPLAAVSPACGVRPNDTVAKLTECVTLEGVLKHLDAFQAAADANGGDRVGGTAGHEASAAYVAGLLSAAGYVVSTQAFSYHDFIQLSPTILQQTAPTVVNFTDRVDHRVMTESASGDVTASVVPVDISPDGFNSTSGCEAADFAGFPAGSIALLQRGWCTFLVKATNAYSAGASGVIIVNQPNTTGPINGTLTEAYTLDMPVVSVTYLLGEQLLSTPGLEMRIIVDALRGEVTTHNVIAETTSGDPANIVLVGAHLDSSDESPGIGNNGSGSAALLETALRMAGVKTWNTVRFAWWSGHAAGQLGSMAYLNGLGATELEAHALYLNVDHIASPNFVRFVLDGDGSTGTLAPPGSEAIESFLRDYYAERGVATKDVLEDAASDWIPFHQAGIPTGGITTVAARLKTAEEEALFGGTANLPFDPCAFLACDGLANVDLALLDLNSDVVAAATLTFAMNTSAVNGKKGKGNFAPRTIQAKSTLADH
jgi:Zn-dependent M28 family amino/carboxypeptidase